jgi:hypothetical protein
LTATYSGDANFSNATSAGSSAAGPAAAVRVAITDIKPANAETAPAKPLTLTAQLCSRESSAAGSVAAK